MKTAVVLADSPDYRPSEDEEFMNERQLEYFKQKLLMWKEDILRESRETLSHLQKETENHPDLADRASSETDRARRERCRSHGDSTLAASPQPFPSESILHKTHALIRPIRTGLMAAPLDALFASTSSGIVATGVHK